MTFQSPDDTAFITAMENAKAKAEDKDRLERARASLETGDGSAHDYLKNEIDPATGERKKKGTANARLTALDIALQGADYHALYKEVGRALSEVQNQVYDRLIQSGEAVDKAEEALKQARRDGASEENITRLEQRLDEARKRHERMQDHDRELADIQRRMNDETNPPTAEELERYRERIGEIDQDMSIRHNSSYDNDNAFNHEKTDISDRQNGFTEKPMIGN